MTEYQARTKWCPFGKSVDERGNPLNRVFSQGTADPDCLCLATDCMAWREEPISMLNNPGIIVGSHGYCGLAGKDDAP